MTTLITGGAGFIGAHVSRELLAENEPLVIYDLPGRGRPIERILTDAERSQLTFVSGDVTDPAQVSAALRQYDVGRIIHLASRLTPTSQADPPAAIRINLQGAANVFEAACAVGIERVAWASSAQVFGPLDRYHATVGIEAILDDSPPYPDSIYGVGKLFLEHVAAQYARARDLDILGLRPPGIFGPGRREGATAYIVDLLRDAVAGRSARVERGDWLLPLLYIEDVARAFAQATLSSVRFRGETFNLGALITSGREIADHVSELVPGATIEVEPCEQRPASRLDGSGIERAMGYRAAHTLRDGLAKTLAALRLGT